MTGAEYDAYHFNFVKKVGNISVASYGGGAPRTARIDDDSGDGCLSGLTMEEVRDLHYALGRLLDLTTP